MVRAHEWDVSRRLTRPGGRRPWWVSPPEPEHPALQLDWESAGAHLIVRMTGDLDVLTAPRLEAFVDELPLAGCAVLEIDLSGVLSMGSVGLSVLLGVRRWSQQRGIELLVRDAQPSVWRVFEVTGLDRDFDPSYGTAAPEPAQELALF